MEWMGVEFEIHAVKTLIHAPWPWKKFTVFSEIQKPPFRIKGHNVEPIGNPIVPLLRPLLGR